jgi:hypothetical protein
MTSQRRATRAPATTSPAHAFAIALGIKAPPEVVRVHVRFSAPKQGSYQPPHYELVIDSTASEWCTYRNYNQSPRPIDPKRVQVPVEMTTCTVLEASRGVPKARVQAWAKALLRCG